jgi:hypothetical protein
MRPVDSLSAPQPFRHKGMSSLYPSARPISQQQVSIQRTERFERGRRSVFDFPESSPSRRLPRERENIDLTSPVKAPRRTSTSHHSPPIDDPLDGDIPKTRFNIPQSLKSKAPSSMERHASGFQSPKAPLPSQRVKDEPASKTPAKNADNIPPSPKFVIVDDDFIPGSQVKPSSIKRSPFSGLNRQVEAQDELSLKVKEPSRLRESLQEKGVLGRANPVSTSPVYRPPIPPKNASRKKPAVETDELQDELGRLGSAPVAQQLSSSNQETKARKTPDVLILEIAKFFVFVPRTKIMREQEHLTLFAEYDERGIPTSKLMAGNHEVYALASSDLPTVKYCRHGGPFILIEDPKSPAGKFSIGICFNNDTDAERWRAMLPKSVPCVSASR